MQVTLNIDILQLSALRSMTGIAVEQALRDYNKYSGSYYHKLFMRAQDLHDEIDAVYVAQCNKIDEAWAMATTKHEDLDLERDMPF